MNTGTLAGMTKQKRGYSREFPVDQSRRIKREIDWVPPALDRAMRAKLKREGLSLRALTLRLWTQWLDEPLRCGVVGEPEAGRKVCELPAGHDGYHRSGTVKWLGYHHRGERAREDGR
jgi:hypothetical protein